MMSHGVVLGHIVSQEGIKVDKANIDLISNLLHPTSVRDINILLGMLVFIVPLSKTFQRRSCHCLTSCKR